MYSGNILVTRNNTTLLFLTKIIICMKYLKVAGSISKQNINMLWLRCFIRIFLKPCNYIYEVDGLEKHILLIICSNNIRACIIISYSNKPIRKCLVDSAISF